MYKILTFAFSVLLFVSCKETQKNQKTEEEMMPVESGNGIGDGAPSLESAFTKTIAEAHNKTAFMNKDAIAFDIDLDFGGKDRLDGTITMMTNSSKIRIDHADGSTLLFDGDAVYMTPQDANTQGARFAMFTWPYFFAFPYKLEDPGSNLELLGDVQVNDMVRESFKLTFEAGTGDAPDDWYVGYLNDDKTVYGTGYVVTFNKSLEKAEQSPHGILYSDYNTVEDIPIATTWTFKNWTKEKGFFGDEIGNATLTNIKFISPEEGFFKKPEQAVEIKK